MRSRRDSGDAPAQEPDYDGAVATLEPPQPDGAAAQRSAPKNKNAIQRVLQFEITKKKVPRNELMHFSRQMAVFIKAGIPILEALDGITAEMGNKMFKEILGDVRERLAAGSTFTDSCGAHPEAFPDYYVGMLRTAELSGTLDTVLVQLSEYIERDLEARRAVTSALIYPAVIAVVGIGVVITLIAFVLPRFKNFFND